MEQLSKEQRESLKKTNNERLRARLVKFGVDEELGFTSERDELLEMMAMQMLKPAAAAPEATQAETIEMRVREMEFREKRVKIAIGNAT